MPLLNPVGLAAGYDKNAEAVAPLSRAGFGFIEVGAATPLAQPGNDKPRLFRLAEDRAAINRFGFNNQGMEAIGTRLAARTPGPVPVGLNLGANKTAQNRAADFAVLATCGPHVDFATVNVSSPNTERLRDLQGRDALLALLGRVMDARRPAASDPGLPEDRPRPDRGRPRGHRRGGPQKPDLRDHCDQHDARPRRPEIPAPGRAWRSLRGTPVRKVDPRPGAAVAADPRLPAPDRRRRHRVSRRGLPEDPRRRFGGPALHGDGLSRPIPRPRNRARTGCVAGPGRFRLRRAGAVGTGRTAWL
jgi:hypothetical protein